MSEATLFEFPYGVFLKQRLEFVVICSDHLEASIMRVIEREMIRQKEVWQAKVEQATEAKKPTPKEPREYWIRLSQAQIIARLYMYDSAKLVKPETEDMESEEWKDYLKKKALSISKSTLVKKINALIDKGFLLMRSKPGDEFGAPLYTLQRANVQKAVKALPTDSFGLFFLGGVSNFESGGESQVLEVPPSNSVTPTSNSSDSHSQELEDDKDSITDSSSDDLSEEEGVGASAQHAPTLEEIDDLTEQVEELIHITDKHKAVTAVTIDDSTKGASNGQLNTSQPVVAVAASTSPAASVSPPSSNGTAQRAAVGRNHVRAQPKPQLTLQGQQVREWYEAIRGKVRLTDKNTIAFSNLGDEPEMTYDNLKDVLEAWDNDKWAKEHNMVPSPQELDSGYLTFEKGLQIVKRNRKMRAGNGAQSSEQFVSKTLDRERNERNLQNALEQAKAIRAAREAATTKG